MEQLTIKLTLEKLNIVMASLSKMPYEAVFQVIEDIRSQAAGQLKDVQTQQPTRE